LCQGLHLCLRDPGNKWIQGQSKQSTSFWGNLEDASRFFGQGSNHKQKVFVKLNYPQISRIRGSKHSEARMLATGILGITLTAKRVAWR